MKGGDFGGQGCLGSVIQGWQTISTLHQQSFRVGWPGENQKLEALLVERGPDKLY